MGGVSETSRQQNAVSCCTARKIQQKGGARIGEHLQMEVKNLQTNVLVEELLQNRTSESTDLLKSCTFSEKSGKNLPAEVGSLCSRHSHAESLSMDPSDSQQHRARRGAGTFNCSPPRVYTCRVFSVPAELCVSWTYLSPPPPRP